MGILEYVKARMAGRTVAERMRIAERAGVPYSTLSKAIAGVQKVSPRLSSVEPVYWLLLSEEKRRKS